MSEHSFPTLPILLVDDELSWLETLSFALEYSGGIDHVRTCRESREVMDILAKEPFSLVLLDLTMPRLSGEELLPLIVRDYPEVPVIILSGLNQAETAANCIKNGAFDYFVKTTEQTRLVAGVRRALAHRELKEECSSLKQRLLHQELDHPEAFQAMVTADPQMGSLFRYAEAVACSSEPVLITGESGTGKELMAQAIHAVSRPGQPWVAVNVAGLDDQVFADTLFGHTRGAFTGADRVRPGMVEQAAGGTLFLDEIGDLSLASQVKLLRLLQEGEYLPLGADSPKRLQARILVATNVDLKDKQAAGQFRKDLYYRLCAHQLQLPPLRERRNDLPLLLEHLLQEATQALGKKRPTPPAELTTLLGTYHFPGNIRELRAMVFDAVSLHQTGKLSMEPFKKLMGLTSPQSTSRLETTEHPVVFGERLPTLAESADVLVDEALRRARGNQSIAARFLGISQQALSKRLKKVQNENA